MATIKEKIALLAESLKGDWFQSDWAGFEGKLIEVLNNMVDETPAAQIQSDWAQADDKKVDFIKNKPTVLTANQVFQQLTVTSTAEQFSSGSDLTEEECCTAMGLTAEQLAGLFAGSYARMNYNTDSFISVVFVSPHLVILGAADTAEIQIAKINEFYTIQVTYV